MRVEALHVLVVRSEKKISKKLKLHPPESYFRPFEGAHCLSEDVVRLDKF